MPLRLAKDGEGNGHQGNGDGVDGGGARGGEGWGEGVPLRLVHDWHGGE